MRNTVLRLPRRINRRDDGRLDLEIVDHVVNEERALVDSGGVVDQGGNAAEDGGQRAGVDGVVTDRHVVKADLVCDEQEESAVHQRRRNVHENMQQILTQKNLLDPGVICLEQRLVAVDKNIVQAQEFDFLDLILVGQNVCAVVHSPPLVGVRLDVLVGDLLVFEVDHGGGQTEDDNAERDQRADRAEQHREADRADQLAAEGQHCIDDGDRARGCLGACILQLFVEGGKIEVGEVDFLGFLGKHGLDADPQGASWFR